MATKYKNLTDSDEVILETDEWFVFQSEKFEQLKDYKALDWNGTTIVSTIIGKTIKEIEKIHDGGIVELWKFRRKAKKFVG